MLNFFPKISDFKENPFSMFITLLYILSISDSISRLTWNLSIMTLLNNIRIDQIIILFLFAMGIFYTIKFIRLTLINFINYRREYYNEYFTLSELQEEGIRENNNVKYQNYIRLKEEFDSKVFLKNIMFAFTVSSIGNYFMKGSIMNSLNNHPLLLFSTISIIGLVILWSFMQDDESNNSTTFIRKKKFSLRVEEIEKN